MTLRENAYKCYIEKQKSSVCFIKKLWYNEHVRSYLLAVEQVSVTEYCIFIANASVTKWVL